MAMTLTLYKPSLYFVILFCYIQIKRLTKQLNDLSEVNTGLCPQHNLLQEVQIVTF